MTKVKSEYDNFERTVAGLLKVPHAEIKDKLEKEQKEKEERKKLNDHRAKSLPDPE